MRTVFTLKLCYFLFLSLVAKYFARHLADSLTGTSARSSSFAHHTMIPATGGERCVTKQNDCAGMNKILACVEGAKGDGEGRKGKGKGAPALRAYVFA